MPYIHKLSDMGHSVFVISEAEMNEERVNLGWKTPETREINIKLEPSEIEIKKIIQKLGKEAIHVIGELRFESRGKMIIRYVNQYGSRLGIVTESPDSRGILGVFRRFKYTLEYYLQGRKFDFIFAMGRKGCRWFTQCGYANSEVFEFAYAVEDVVAKTEKSNPPSTSKSLNNPFQLLYVGRLIPLKKVDFLIRCIAEIREPFTLEIVGSGPEEKKLKKLSSQLNLADKITWTANVSCSVVREKMERADTLVLPSHHDGWGAVVSEALLSGTPVICSDACGVSCLIESENCGAVFTAQNLSELKEAIADRIRKGKQSKTDRHLLKAYSSERYGSTAVAKYFELVMHHIYCNKQRPNNIGGRSVWP